MTYKEKIDRLNDREFENLTFDLCSRLGLRNIVWRTPGSDGGRDLEGDEIVRDLTGHTSSKKWFIECKRYKASVSWPTLWEKIAHADALGADYLLLSTNSNPSPMCEERVAQWNLARKRPVIRILRGYDFPKMLKQFPDIAASYGIIEVDATLEKSLFEISRIGQNVSQAALLAAATAQPVEIPSRAATSISELIAQRLDDLHRYSSFRPFPRAFNLLPEITGGIEIVDWDEAGLRSVVSFIAYLTYSKTVQVTVEAGGLSILPKAPRCKLDANGWKLLTTLQPACFCDLALDGMIVRIGNRANV